MSWLNSLASLPGRQSTIFGTWSAQRRDNTQIVVRQLLFLTSRFLDTTRPVAISMQCVPPWRSSSTFSTHTGAEGVSREQEQSSLNTHTPLTSNSLAAMYSTSPSLLTSLLPPVPFRTVLRRQSGLGWRKLKF